MTMHLLKLAGVVCAALFAPYGASASETRPDIVVVVGARGTPELGAQFELWENRFRQLASQAQVNYSSIGLESPQDAAIDRDVLKARLASLDQASPEAVWLVLIGHGTFDGKTARFNLRGEDIAATELALWLAEFRRPLAIVNCASSSGPFLNALSAPGRVVVTATRSGHEFNLARFGDHFSAAWLDQQADLDKDEQVSLLEAFLMAASRVRESYEAEGRLATEHPLIDDNGDRLGTPPDWYDGVIAVKTAKAGSPADGLFASQWHLVRSAADRLLPPETRERRDALERQIAGLRLKKSTLSEDDYLDALEPLVAELARLMQANPEAKPE